MNVYLKTIKVNPRVLKRLTLLKEDLRFVADNRNPLNKRREVFLQKGEGFLSLILTPIVEQLARLLIQIMEHVKRLVLVPEHMAENTTESKPLVPPLTSQVNHLDSEMGSLLKRQDITQDEKARLYSQILQRYLNYYDKKMSHPVRVSVVSSKPTTEVGNTTRTCRSTGQYRN